MSVRSASASWSALASKLRRIIEENEIQPPQRLGHRAVFHTPADDRREALVERGGVRDFLERHVRSDGVRREHKHDRVGFADQRLNALPPILEGINLGAVDQRLEAARLKSRFEPIREGHVLARIRDENSGFRLNVRPSFRNHRRVPSRRRMLPDSGRAEKRRSLLAIKTLIVWLLDVRPGSIAIETRCRRHVRLSLNLGHIASPTIPT